MRKKVSTVGKSKRSGKVRLAVVAVGGEGIRIGTKNNPKLLLKVNGHPFLYFVLVLLLGQLEEIYLLTGVYSRQIRGFVRESFPAFIGRRIHLINGGKNGNARAIAKLRGRIDEPFLYMDGNVICSPSVLKKISCTTSSGITLMVSPVSLIHTHLHVRVKGDKILEMLPIVHDEWEKRGLLCSLGIMILDNRLFGISPGMNSFDDFDLLIDFIFRNRLELKIKPLVYKGWWCCIHTIKDVQFARKYGGKLFSALSNRAVSQGQKGGDYANIQRP